MGTSALTIGLSGAPAPARGQAPPARACVAAYSSGLEHQRSGHLREGRERLLECAKATCGPLQKKCAAGAGQLASEIAWIAPVVTDEAGGALLDVEVRVDGESRTTRLDGRPLAIDPGVHEFSVSARVGPWPGHEVSTTQTITVEQGQRGAIAISLPPQTSGALATAADRADEPPAESTPAPAPVPPEHAAAETTVRHGGGPSAFAYLLGGVGLLGVGAGGLLTYWGKTDNTALASCAPNCQPASVDHIRRLYLAADISFAAGGVALGSAALLFATSRSAEAGPSPAAKASPARAFTFDVRPVRSGAFASLKGTF